MLSDCPKCWNTPCVCPESDHGKMKRALQLSKEALESCSTHSWGSRFNECQQIYDKAKVNAALKAINELRP